MQKIARPLAVLQGLTHQSPRLHFEFIITSDYLLLISHQYDPTLMIDQVLQSPKVPNFEL